MRKRIISRDELIGPKIKGMQTIAAIVKETLGPAGRPIIIERVGQTLEGTPIGPKITKDGVSVADECSSHIKEEDVIIQAVKGICKKTVTTAGDGTTTAIVLGEAILLEMERVLKENPNLNPQLVKESLDQATVDVVKMLKKMAKPVKTNKMIRQVATISANGDKAIGDIIGEAFEHVGAEGVVTVDEGRTSKVVLEKVDGYQFPKGAEGRSAFFNSKDGTKFEAEDVAVLIYDGRIYNFNDLVPTLITLAVKDHNGEPTASFIKPLIIIANEFSPEVLQFLLVQKERAGLVVCPILGPNATNIRTNFYDDMAKYTGATRLGNGQRSLLAMEPDDLGISKRVVTSKYKTTLYDGQGSEEEILKQVDSIKAQKLEAESPYDEQILNDRLAALTKGIARISVGGVTEFEIKEKYDRIDDSLNAARSAIEEGVVPGGGTTLLRIAYNLTSDTVGNKILKIALKAPFRQILINRGMSESFIGEVQDRMLANYKLVYDSREMESRKAMNAGIIDPVKVTRTALENAVSIAGLISTAGGAIIYVSDKD